MQAGLELLLFLLVLMHDYLLLINYRCGPCQQLAPEWRKLAKVILYFLSQLSPSYKN